VNGAGVNGAERYDGLLRRSIVSGLYIEIFTPGIARPLTLDLMVRDFSPREVAFTPKRYSRENKSGRSWRDSFLYLPTFLAPSHQLVPDLFPCLVSRHFSGQTHQAILSPSPNPKS
jgi:hypothetical protein